MRVFRIAAVMCAFVGPMAVAQSAPSSAATRAPLGAAAGQAAASAAPQASGTAAAQIQPPAGPPAPIQFPAVDPSKITAPSPTPDTVNSFLHSVWGLDEDREWRIASIQPANVPGFVKVEVYVAERRQPTRIANYSFLVTPDGKHAVQGELASFGAHPFEETRTTLQQRADGPARGAATAWRCNASAPA